MNSISQETWGFNFTDNLASLLKVISCCFSSLLNKIFSEFFKNIKELIKLILILLTLR